MYLSSDSETLIKSWEEWGIDSLSRLNGIYSFAIYDKHKGKVFLVRDPFGVKPLYIYNDHKSLAFSSEIKTLLNIKNFDSTIDFESIVNYMNFLWSPGSKTMYKNVKILPGDVLSIDTKSHNITKKSTNKIDYFNGDYWNLSESEWVKKIDNKLNEVIEKQMISDAPVGFFLSGGLDSSLIVSIAKSQFPTAENWNVLQSTSLKIVKITHLKMTCLMQKK